MKFKDIFNVVWEPIKKIILVPFWWLILLIVIFSVPILRIWWWFLTPIILFFPLRTTYLWWIGQDFWYQKQRWVMLELTPPKEVLAPFSAMDDVFSVVWSVVDKPNWREKWCEGELPLGPYWCSWEIISIEGNIHFYVRCLEEHRHVIESVLYSHYPELEIKQVDDYTRNVPQNIPNEEWDIYGEDYILGREDTYPIKTYSKFFEPQGERITKEEKRIDPIISLLEDMARVGSGEQVWFQMIITPLVDADAPCKEWKEKTKKIIAKMARREGEKEKTIMEELGEMLGEIIFPPKVDEKGKIKKPVALRTETGEREMLLTPGEKEILSAIEEKIKKPAFKVNLRNVYIAKRDSFQGPHGKIVRAYFTHFAAQNLNYIRFSLKTRTKVHYIWRARRKHLRARKLFINYVQRNPPLFPEITGEGNIILNTEELATIFHFPTKLSALVAPTVERVEAKKGGPPADLPTE